MEHTAGIQVVVTLFGLRGGDARRARISSSMPTGTTVRTLLNQFRSQAAPGDRLATVHVDALLVLINGRPIQYLDGWDTVLRDRDEVACLLKAAGG